MAGNSPGAQRNPFRFTGALHSPELGLYKMGERWYDAALGRWTQADPLLQPYSSREPNRYGYAAADPTIVTDASGRTGEGLCNFLTVYIPSVISGILGVLAGKKLSHDPAALIIGPILIGPIGNALGVALAKKICGPPGGPPPPPPPPADPSPKPAPIPDVSILPKIIKGIGIGIGIGSAIGGIGGGAMPGCASAGELSRSAVERLGTAGTPGGGRTAPFLYSYA